MGKTKKRGGNIKNYLKKKLTKIKKRRKKLPKKLRESIIRQKSLKFMKNKFKNFNKPIIEDFNTKWDVISNNNNLKIIPHRKSNLTEKLRNNEIKKYDLKGLEKFILETEKYIKNNSDTLENLRKEKQENDNKIDNLQEQLKKPMNNLGSGVVRNNKDHLRYYSVISKENEEKYIKWYKDIKKIQQETLNNLIKKDNELHEEIQSYEEIIHNLKIILDMAVVEKNKIKFNISRKQSFRE